jgi:(3,5-dihydroxyphenyl)acetyl-CoA 1,2-dioxygenase
MSPVDTHPVDTSKEADILVSAGLPADAVAAWHMAAPKLAHAYAEDCARFSDFWLQSNRLLGLLPPAGGRSEHERTAAERIAGAARRARTQFLREHVETLYGALTAGSAGPARIEHLVVAAAEAAPGLVPGKADLAAEDGLLQRDRSGIEIDQGVLASAILENPRTGRHLCHSMLLPRPESLDLLDRLKYDGHIALTGATVQRHGRASIVTYVHPRFLNAEDQGTLDAMEICVDLALLDDATDIVVLRGGLVEHPKYSGRRLFGAGINLTHLYHGRIPFVWYLQRDLGYVNKIYRGLAVAGDPPPDECGGATIEKLWIAAVEGFAIGGHCQVLLVCDQVIAERDAYLTLPARKEGIIPGAANLRLPRFTGDRIARQAILNERRIECASREGRMICDAIVDTGAMDAAIDEQVSRLTSSGVVSAAGNRRAFRIAQEPLDLFRSYMAIYAREQAWCHFSPALIGNLERHWNAQNRKP